MALAKILVATDFSGPAQRATQRAAHLARQTEADLRLVHVLPEQSLIERLFQPRGIAHADMFKGAQRALQTTCKEIARTIEVEATWDVLTGAAASTIDKAVTAFSADLLVVGACGENAPSPQENCLGGTALKLISQSTVPLLLVRRPAEEPYGRVVLGAGDEETTRRILAVVQSFAGDSECHLVHAFETEFAARLKKLGIAREAIETYGLEGFTAAEQALERLIGESIFKDRLRSCVVRGNPGSAVMREIDRLEPDLIAVGKHGNHARRAKNAGPGSVSLRVALSSHCDVLQVP